MTLALLLMHIGRNQRYTAEDDDSTFDWFKSYEELAPLIHELISDKSARILMLGCGNSSLSEMLWDDGYKNIVNVDYSSVVIEKMRQRYETSRPGMGWREMDVRKLEYGSDTFDVTIDKGTMDSMLTVPGDVWNPPAQAVDDCNREVDEVLRVLRRGNGIFLYITFGQPHFRRRYLTRPETTLEVRELGDSFHYYMYIMRKP